MTIWVLWQSLTAQEEALIGERKTLVLPFEGMPDLSLVTSEAQAKQLLLKLYPDEPPEAINRRLDRFWSIYPNLQVEDIIAVPLPARKQVALAHITGSYSYELGQQKEDIHLIPVNFYPKKIPLSVFRKHKDLFIEGNRRLFEVKDAEARIKIRDQLPHSYNRFAKFKWLLAVFFVMGLVRMLHWFKL